MLFKGIGYDIRQGIAFNAWKIAGAALLFFILGLSFSTLYHHSCAWYEYEGNISTYNVLLYYLRGNFGANGKDGTFNVPAVWVIIQAYLLIVLAGYPKNDIHSYGQQVFVRMRSRSKWWLSKCVWNAIMVLLYYGLAYVSAMIVALGNGGTLGLEIDRDVAGRLTSLSSISENITQGQIFIALVLLPILVMLAMGMLQMLLAFVLDTTLSFLLVITYLFLGMYYTYPWFIVNFSMVMRSNWFIDASVDHVNSEIGAPICIAVWIVATAVGFWQIQRYEIYEKT